MSNMSGKEDHAEYFAEPIYVDPDPVKIKKFFDEDDYFARDKWTYPSEDAFLEQLNAETVLGLTPHREAHSELCNRCAYIDLRITLTSLHDPKDNCALCQILSKRLMNNTGETKMRLLEARRYVRICAVPEPQDYSGRTKPIQTGLPDFLQSGSSSHFKLIRAWLQLCDEGRCSRDGGCCPKPNSALMPTRVVDVENGRTARLVSTDKMRQGEHYITLSHCWGKLTERQKDSWCTNRKNEEHRRTQGFSIEQLPQTFQDAIRVTRELDQRYLWVDSLCIIQGEGGDWDTEAKRMETVFRHAYCTIAATSAEDSTKGFLDRPVEHQQYVTVPRSSHGKVYICTSIDDFPGDVEESVLNKRAWVLQERALSRRTIHFTSRQTYWECGGGVRCETLTYMRNGKLSFQSDPDFPLSVRGRSRQAKVKLFQSLFAGYSKLDLTEETDRSVAIDSLATALAGAFRTDVRYGIFGGHYLYRSLLWQRPQDTPLTRISYAADKAVPSWSWMAYRGPIEYLGIPVMYGLVVWENSVRFMEDKASNAAGKPQNDTNVLEARVRRLQDCEIKPEGPIHVIRDKKDENVGHLRFDTQPGEALTEVWCAIMGRGDIQTGEEVGLEVSKRKYYVLFVTKSAIHPERGTFERVGVGSVQERFIRIDGQDDMAWIL